MRTSKGTKIIAIIALVGTASIGVLPTPAQAHYVKESTDVWDNGIQCVEGWSEISHGTGKGFMKVETSSTKALADPFPPVHCAVTRPRPPRWIRMEPEVWGYVSDRSQKCADWGSLYNGVETWRITKKVTFDDLPGGPCEHQPHWYGTYAGHHVYYNGDWEGATLFSGWHWLPDYSAKEAAMSDAALAGAEKDAAEHTMIVDRSRLPAELMGEFQVPTGPPPPPGVTHEGGDPGLDHTVTYG